MLSPAVGLRVVSRFADHFDLDALQKKDFMWLTEVNVVGTYQMTRACVPYMKKNGKNGGSVVNVSSLAGIRGIGSSIAYAATKGWGYRAVFYIANEF
jgi:3-oxoacyl-[acyl-carrier protein] reductase